MKKTIALILVLVICLSLVACGPSQEDVVGIWTGKWTYEGNTIEKTLLLSPDGTYGALTYKNGALDKLEGGTYEISGKEVELHPDGNTGITTPYDYKRGKLVNNGHELVRQ